MKPSIIAAALFGTGLLAFSQSPVAEPAPQMAPPSASRMVKPDPSVTVHVPSLPPGIGFVVISTEEGGPARAAGIREFDLLWKLGDQMLVNEAQVATLLRLSKPGDEVVLTGFRAGKPLEVKLKLGDAAEFHKSLTGEVAESAILPGEHGVPRRIVNVYEKSASYTAGEGKAVVQRSGDGYSVKIQDLKNQPIYEGPVPSDGKLEPIPEPWRRRVMVLCRTLDHALANAEAAERGTRHRVVPPSLSKP
jgi:hypothetical protein